MIENTEVPVFSVSEFVEYVNIALGQRRVSVEGEISGYRLNQNKWIFFDLKDENSIIGCFAAAWNLHAALEDGMQVVVHGVPRVYGKSGKFSITVDAVELRGEGALRRAYGITKKKLDQEGLFDPARKRGLPRFPEKIGVIASRESAAYTDFMRIVNARWGGLEISLFHVQVQGHRAIRDIVSAFEWFNTDGIQQGIQSLALIRGGGSLEDLQAFNSESVARAVFGSKIPIICGVGHERDESLADYTADVRAATPTHAATLMVPDREEVGGVVSDSLSSLSRSLEYALEWYGGRIHTSTLSIHASVRDTVAPIGALMHRFDVAGGQVHATIATLRHTCAQNALRLADYLASHVSSARQSLAFMDRTLGHMNPLTVLARGYTIVKRNGALITRKAHLKKGDELALTFADGSALTEVKHL
ncbi:exodeoxyribonuclease VII large subunit [Candidatus Uhrbacteria bacterium]|nr:exodeoxyribonuclease VII large subunit [Candidatus Uhrbacteria bacterium]